MPAIEEIVAHLADPVDDITISKKLLSRRIYAAPLSSFYANTARSNGFALGFAGTPESRIRPAVRELVKAIREVSSLCHPT
jgi:DNA-binding transcriptional MocR family regulator